MIYAIPCRSARLLGLRDRSVEVKEMLDSRYIQRVMDSLIYTDQSEAAPIFLSRDIGPDQRSDSSGIGERHIGEIDNQSPRLVGTHFRLKAKYILKGQGPGKAQNVDSLAGTGEFFDVQGLVRHAKNVKWPMKL
jgi:hypothetical protein